MFWCYILHSESLGRFYIGSTQTSVEERLTKHCSAHYPGSHFTHQATDWIIFLSIKCKSYEQARHIENHIKKMKSKTYIFNLRKYPEMIEKLLRLE